MQKKTKTSYTSMGIQSIYLVFVLKSIPYSDLGPLLKPKGPGIKIVIGPIFYDNVTLLNSIEDITFLSLTKDYSF